MLHIILSLLKIAGIFLLILLGILLLLIVQLLAAPVTYEISGGWDGTAHLKGRIRWLYRIIGVSIHMEDMQPQVRITVFGHTPGAGKKKRSGERIRKGSSEKPLSEEKLVPEKEPLSEEKLVPEKESLSEEKLPPEGEPLSEEELFSGEETFSEEELLLESGSAPGVNPECQESEEVFFPDKNGSEEEEAENPEKSSSLPDMVNRVLDFINEPSVRRLLSLFRKSICRIFRHLRPSSLQIQARIGMDDPALTGKIMELAAVLYAFYQENIQITADFDEKVLEAEAVVKGWLVPGYLIIKLLGMALRLFLSRECRAFYREIKESLT